MRVEQAHIRRLKTVLIFGILFWSALVAMLVFIQLKSSALFQEKAQQQHLREWPLESRRGLLYDRRMKPLAMNMPFYSLAACPEKVENHERVAACLAPIVGMKQRKLLGLLRQNCSFLWLARKIELDVGNEFQSPHIPGILIRREVFRYYPNGRIGGQVVGFSDLDNFGLEGMELQLDSLLSGTPGRCMVEMDAARRRHSDVKLPYTPPEDGCDIVLTIDVRCQTIVEEELRAALDRHGAQAALAVVMIPQTGEIIAMANLPECDPNQYKQYAEHDRKNRVVTDTFEPGSIFKIVTAAAALQEGVMNPEDSLFAENGKFTYAGSVLHDWKKFGWVTFREAIEHSVNIAVAKAALEIGPTTFYEYATKFGFGCMTGVQFPGEVKGVLRNPAKWSKRSLITLALGQEVSVTALQMACAYAAIANGGQLMQPKIVKKVLDQRGDVIREMEPTRVRTVLRPGIARELTHFLTGVVHHGTGTKAKIMGIEVAGKTGTAQKAEVGGYSESKFVASFVGFLPAEDPRLVGLIVVDEPQGVHWGGEVAAPVFGRIMKRLLYLPGGPVEGYLLAQGEPLADHRMASAPGRKDSNTCGEIRLSSQSLENR